MLPLAVDRGVGRDPAAGAIRIAEFRPAVVTHHQFVPVVHDDPDGNVTWIGYRNEVRTGRSTRGKRVILLCVGVVRTGISRGRAMGLLEPSAAPAGPDDRDRTFLCAGRPTVEYVRTLYARR
ncbi:hypothetical protein C487_11072 [Natrinema pallidum DSM 3751]|uniref:Uncharacterized protein n=1 Tax=Natrinema pallidum DSM 3751 TaxID=1227495 RepID=L9YSH1_9EURY|nr:hypothetical protein C487_11072 [Natrinema pallidum DSM 3751]